MPLILHSHLGNDNAAITAPIVGPAGIPDGGNVYGPVFGGKGLVLGGAFWTIAIPATAWTVDFYFMGKASGFSDDLFFSYPPNPDGMSLEQLNGEIYVTVMIGGVWKIQVRSTMAFDAGLHRLTVVFKDAATLRMFLDGIEYVVNYDFINAWGATAGFRIYPLVNGAGFPFQQGELKIWNEEWTPLIPIIPNRRTSQVI